MEIRTPNSDLGGPRPSDFDGRQTQEALVLPITWRPSIKVRVTDRKDEWYFRIHWDTCLEQMTYVWCGITNKEVGSVKFLYAGCCVQLSDTPDSLEMDVGHAFEAVDERVRSGCESSGRKTRRDETK